MAKKKATPTPECIEFARIIDFTELYVFARKIRGDGCIFDAPVITPTDKYPNDDDFSGVFVRIKAQDGLNVQGTIRHGTGELRFACWVHDDNCPRNRIVFGAGWYADTGWKFYWCKSASEYEIVNDYNFPAGYSMDYPCHKSFGKVCKATHYRYNAGKSVCTSV